MRPKRWLHPGIQRLVWQLAAELTYPLLLSTMWMRPVFVCGFALLCRVAVSALRPAWPSCQWCRASSVCTSEWEESQARERGHDHISHTQLLHAVLDLRVERMQRVCFGLECTQICNKVCSLSRLRANVLEHPPTHARHAPGAICQQAKVLPLLFAPASGCLCSTSTPSFKSTLPLISVT